jgi:Amt family ammonium transporter
MINSGDTAWILISAALVMLMTPGVALFYGGMVRKKNVLSTMMMSLAPLALVGILWVLYGYSLVFAPDTGGVIGNLNFIGLNNVGQTPSSTYAATVPQLAFMAYQAMFAIITVVLVTGAIVERMKFSALLIFAGLWFTLVYIPVAHWVWGGGWLQKMGVLDFAGGIVVHVTAGFSALTLAAMLGPRKGFLNGETMAPHDIPMVVLGAGLLWFGWFGFNAGSALTSGGVASSAFVTTNTSACAAALTWMILSWIYRRPSTLGVVTGAIAGLAAITPAAGYVTPLAAIPIGVVAALICYFSMIFRSKRIDESLDVWAVHGMGGLWGSFAVGIFATVAVNASGANGAIAGNALQILKQILGIAVAAGFSVLGTFLITKLLQITMGIRVSKTEETVGLDISQHGETAYSGQ